MPLTFADMGKEYTIVKITGKDEVRTHLRNLGFVEKGTVSVIQSLNGNLIVQVKDGRIAMDAGLAKRIMV
jgi:ferrous iron transport protein A